MVAWDQGEKSMFQEETALWAEEVDEGGCLQAGDEKKQEQGKQDTQVIPGLRASFVDKSQLTKLRTPLVV